MAADPAAFARAVAPLGNDSFALSSPGAPPSSPLALKHRSWGVGGSRGSTRGALLGVAHFLRNLTGVHFVDPAEVVLPHPWAEPDPASPGLPLVWTAPFEMRDTNQDAGNI